MANLAIKCSLENYGELVSTLKMLGDVRDKTTDDNKLYFYIRPISDNFVIAYLDDEPKQCAEYKNYTLKEFYDNFPYKIGDNVMSPIGEGVVSSMYWDKELEDIRYTISLSENRTGEFYTKSLYRILVRDTRTENKTTVINIPEGSSVKDDKGNIINTKTVEIVRKTPDYPKNYKEACDILGFDCSGNTTNIYTHCFQYDVKLKNLYKLILCRDAFWTVAGLELGLDTSWKPDIVNGVYTATIINRSGRAVMDSGFDCENRILMFHDDKVRDKFHQYFFDLIENCLEYL